MTARRRSAAEEMGDLLAAVRVLSRRLASPAHTVDPRRLLRLARALVRVAEANDPGFIAVTAAAESMRDPPGRAALLALLTVAAARTLTTARRALVRLALTVLVAELGAPRPGGDPIAESPDEARAVPSAAAAAVITLFAADPPALQIADAAYDAAFLHRGRALGQLDRPIAPRAAARLINIARAYLDRLAPPDGSPARSPHEALSQVAALRSVDADALRCLVRALGLTPAGAIVELTSGEQAVVLPPATAVDPIDRPRVRLLTDSAGRVLNPPRDLDLADPAHQNKRIGRVLDPAAASNYVLAAFLPGA